MLKNFGAVLSYFVIILFSTSYISNAQTNASLKTIVIDPGHGLPNSNAQGKYSYESALTLAIGQKLSDRLKQVLPECNILLTRTDENLPAGLKDKNVANRWRAQYANDNHGDLFISIHVNDMDPHYQRRIEGYREETYYVYTGKKKKRKKIEKTRSVPIYKSYKLGCPEAGTETYIWAVNKYEQKQKSVGNRDTGETAGELADSTGNYFDTPEAKIVASLRTKKYFNQSLLLGNLVEEEFTKLGGRRSGGVKQRNNEGIWVLQATNMPSILIETGFICNPNEEDYLNSDKGQNELTYAIMRAVLRYKQGVETGVIPPASDDSTNTK